MINFIIFLKILNYIGYIFIYILYIFYIYFIYILYIFYRYLFSISNSIQTIIFDKKLINKTYNNLQYTERLRIKFFRS
jgi:hypothetical protein